jgi:DNA-binding response OmpR family regulator
VTAVVADADAVARRQVTELLQLGGWQVHEAASVDEALARCAAVSPDLVVTDMVLPGGSGPDVLTRLRRSGSSARFLVVTAEPIEAARVDSDAAGALACLAKPIDARLLLELVARRRVEPAAPEGPIASMASDDLSDVVQAELMPRLQKMYDDALPTRLTAIAATLREGNARAVADAAQTLAGASGQLGHPEVAGICRAIAADARRGILAHHLVADLATVALAVDDPAADVPAGWATAR